MHVQLTTTAIESSLEIPMDQPEPEFIDVVDAREYDKLAEQLADAKLQILKLQLEKHDLELRLAEAEAKGRP
jgi:hypothetical protein